jgi:hypothetical protein
MRLALVEAMSRSPFESAPLCSNRKLTRLHACASYAAVIASTALIAPAALAEEGRSNSSDDVGSTHIAVDFDYAAAISENQDIDAGTGGAIRLGREIDLLLVSLTPEVGGMYESFSGSPNTRVYGGFAGGRLGVGKIIEPSVFAHVGVAHIDGWQNRTAPTLDAGLALDFTLLPLIDLGVHAGLNTLMATREGNGVTWATAGFQAALVF